MPCETLDHYVPTKEEYAKFNKINAMPEEKWKKACAACNDCSVCNMAIHQVLYTTTKHTCVYGMPKKRFEICMDDADCYF